MPNNVNRRRGIAGIPGRNLNSVRGSLDISGLYPVRMWHGGTPHEGEMTGDQNAPRSAEAQIRQFIDFQAGTRPSSTATLEELQTREDFFKTYLGDSGYKQERETSQKNAKLQAALALAQAGFGLMGAQPREGESPMSVMGRAFGAPLAERMGDIAGTFAERDAARRTAQRAEERQIKLQAFQDVTSRKQAEATRYTEDRKSAWEAISSGTSFLKNQQTKIDGVWTDVGQIRRVMTGLFKNIPKYYNATTGTEITTPIRDFMAPEKGYKDKVTIIGKTLRRISAPTTEDPNAVEWIREPVFSRSTFDKYGAYQDSSFVFRDGSSARFTPETVKAPGEESVTYIANAKFEADAEALKQGTRGFVKKIGDDGKPTGDMIPLNYTYDSVKGYDIWGLGTEDKNITLGGPNPTYVLVDAKTGEVAGPKLTGTDKPTVVDMGLARKWIEDPDDPTKLIPGLPEETKGLLIDGVLRQVVPSPDGTQNVFIKIGRAAGEYEIYEPPKTPTAPTDTDDPEFKATFAGLLANLPGMRQRMNLGRKGMAFDPAKFNINPDLTPGDNFPFTRVDGMALSEEQQKNYARNLKNTYFNLFKVIKTGEEKADLNRSFVTGFLDYDVGSLGLPQAPKGQRLVTTPADIQQAYVAAADQFKTNPNAETIIEGLPLPIGPKNLRSAIGRLPIFYALGVPFGATTQAPEALLPKASPEDVVARAAAVRSLVADNRDAIQTRILAEREAKSTRLGSKLTPRNADTLGKQLPIVGEALEAQKDKLRVALDDPAGKVIGEIVGKSLDTIAMLDRIDALQKISGFGGFVLGPVEQFATARFDVDLGAWFRTEAGQEAAKELMASIPILKNLVGRDLLKGVGEQRISNQDLLGIQATLLNINKADDFNARTLRQLRNYLKRSVTHSLEYVGSYGLPEKTLHRAAQLGIDVKSIEGRNGFYSPYLADQTYAVTRQNVPSYSREYQTQLRDESIFGYVARSGGRGQPKQYELIRVDADGEPIWDEEYEKYETTLIPHEEGWQARIEDKAMLDFNRKFLMQTYGLDR